MPEQLVAVFEFPQFHLKGTPHGQIQGGQLRLCELKWLRHAAGIGKASFDGILKTMVD